MDEDADHTDLTPEDIVTRDSLVALLAEKAELCNASRGQRLRALPWRMVYSKAVEIINRVFGLSAVTLTKTFWGDQITVILPDRVSVLIFRHGFYEMGLTAFLLAHLKPGDVFVDIGAHIGFFTLLAARVVGDSGKVISFEPTPSTFTLLKANAGRRRNVALENLAVWSATGSLTLNDYGKAYCAFNTVTGARLDAAELKRLRPRKVKVQTVSMDQYLMDHSIRPNLIKIDAESAEMEILKGLEETMKTTRPILSVEVGDFGISNVASSRTLIDYITAFGYEPIEFRDGEFGHHQPRESYKYDNIFFLPRS